MMGLRARVGWAIRRRARVRDDIAFDEGRLGLGRSPLSPDDPTNDDESPPVSGLTGPRR